MAINNFEDAEAFLSGNPSQACDIALTVHELRMVVQFSCISDCQNFNKQFSHAEARLGRRGGGF